MEDDLKPRPKPPEHVMGQDLSTLSVHELKQSSKSAAESVFKF
jgi:uncharacterized small protein (DUF1192 family)